MTVDTFAPPAEAPVEEAGRSRRTVLVAGGAAAALVLGGGGYFLLSGGSDSTPESAAPISLPHAVRPAAKAPAKPAAKKPVVKVPATSTVPLGRDPFRALYIAPVATAVVPASTGTTGTTTPTTPTQPAGGTTTPAQPVPAAPTSYKLVLTRVYGSGKDLTGVFSVGGKTMLAKVGSVFGPTGELKLLSLSESPKGVWTATLQVGDSEPVDASRGETLYVR